MLTYWEGWKVFLRLFEWDNEDMRQGGRKSFTASYYFEGNDPHSYKRVLKGYIEKQ